MALPSKDSFEVKSLPIPGGGMVNGKFERHINKTWKNRLSNHKHIGECRCGLARFRNTMIEKESDKTRIFRNQFELYEMADKKKKALV